MAEDGVIKLPLTPKQQEAYQYLAENGRGLDLKVTIDMGSTDIERIAVLALELGIVEAQVKSQKKFLGLSTTGLLTLTGPATRVAPVVLVMNESYERVQRIVRGEDAGE